MRAWDKREIYATRWTDDPVHLAADAASCAPMAWIIGIDEPVVAIGARPIHPGVWSVFMFATDLWPSVALSTTRFVRRVMIPALRSTGAHRAECRSMEGHAQAQRWLERLGARREATLEGYGREGQNFHVYCWSR